jgi:uncharacterized protein
MTDAFDERRKALEDEYFLRKDRESLRNLRESLKEAARVRGEDVPVMDCPRCDGKLYEKEFDDVRVDRCDKCGGIWLDAGEYEHFSRQESPAGRWFRVFWPGKTTD